MGKTALLFEFLDHIRVRSVIEPGTPGESGYCESFNSKLREEFLNGEILTYITAPKLFLVEAELFELR